MRVHLQASLRVLFAFAALVATWALLTPPAAARVAVDQPDSPEQAAAPPAADQPDSPEQAAAAPPVPVGPWLSGVLAGDADQDWFGVRLGGGTALITLGDLLSDYRLTLADAAGRALAVSDRGGETFEQLQRRLPAGRYLVGVDAPRGGADPERPYRLQIRPLPARLMVLDAHPVTVDKLYAITGQLLNNTGSWRRYPMITARFYGADGRFLGDTTGLAAQTYLGPNQRGHFRLVADRPAGTVRYTLAVSAPRVTPPRQPALVVEPDRPYPVEGGRIRYVGRIGGGTAENVHVFVPRYNRIGQFVDAGHAVLARVNAVAPARYELELPDYAYLSGSWVVYSVG
jgi:hypothetical protein